MRMGLSLFVAMTCASAVPAVLQANAGASIVDQAFKAFTAHCFNPRLVRADLDGLAEYGINVDFYDLNPFSAPAITPVTGRAATPDTDRRCEIAFDADRGADAAVLARQALTKERILTDTPLPDTHSDAALPDTTLLAARKLNPNRIAVVHTGTRQGQNGVETFLMVERLTPEASKRQN